MKNEFSNKLKIINFLGAICVLIAHFNSVDGYNLKYVNGNFNMIDCYINITNQLCQIAMTMFFMLSAFLFYFNINNSKDAFYKMKKRVKTLLVPYMVWIVIIWCLRFLIFSDPNTYINSLVATVRIVFLHQ